MHVFDEEVIGGDFVFADDDGVLDAGAVGVGEFFGDFHGLEEDVDAEIVVGA